jgi:hypothetical protein
MEAINFLKIGAFRQINTPYLGVFPGFQNPGASIHFCVGEFGRGGVFSHDAVSDMIIRQKITIGFAGGVLVGKDLI